MGRKGKGEGGGGRDGGGGRAAVGTDAQKAEVADGEGAEGWE